MKLLIITSTLLYLTVNLSCNQQAVYATKSGSGDLYKKLPSGNCDLLSSGLDSTSQFIQRNPTTVECNLGESCYRITTINGNWTELGCANKANLTDDFNNQNQQIDDNSCSDPDAKLKLENFCDMDKCHPPLFMCYLEQKARQGSNFDNTFSELYFYSRKTSSCESFQVRNFPSQLQESSQQMRECPNKACGTYMSSDGVIMYNGCKDNQQELDTCKNKMFEVHTCTNNMCNGQFTQTGGFILPELEPYLQKREEDKEKESREREKRDNRKKLNGNLIQGTICCFCVCIGLLCSYKLCYQEPVKAHKHSSDKETRIKISSSGSNRKKKKQSS